MFYEEFLEHYPMNTMLIHVYLNSENYIDDKGEMNQDAEIEKYKVFAELLKEKKYVSSQISTIYITPEAYALYEEGQHDNVSIGNYYRDLEEKESEFVFVTRNIYELLKNGEIDKTNEEFYNI